ncbi:MAG: hypothetical protein ACYC5Q_11725 [Thermoleophilia bacterium]
MMKRQWKSVLSAVLFLAIVGGTLGLLQGRGESAESLRSKALEAVTHLGPVKVVGIDEIYGEDGVAHQAQIIQLLDKDSGLARETVVDLNTGETVSERSVIGNEVTSVDWRVDYVSHYSGLEPPRSPLTLWGGYEDLLANGKPVEASDTPDGLHRVVVLAGDLTITAYLDSTYMPVRLEFDEADAPHSPSRAIAYEAIEAMEPLSADEVRLASLPTDPLVVESHRILPTHSPRITESVPFGQYWFDTSVLGRSLVSADYVQFSPRPDYEPTGITGLVLIYQADGEDNRDKNKDIQLTCHPLKGDHAEMALADYEANASDRVYESLQRDVAGQEAQVLVKTVPGDTSRIVNALIILDDAVLEVNANISPEELEKLLVAVRPLE